MANGNAAGDARETPDGRKFQTASWPFVGEMTGTTPFTADAPAIYATIGPLVPQLVELNVCDA